MGPPGVPASLVVGGPGLAGVVRLAAVRAASGLPRGRGGARGPAGARRGVRRRVVARRPS